jgi:hypothetical protein
MKQALGVAIGYILWSILWLALNQLLLMLGLLTSPTAAHPLASATQLLILLVGSALISLLSGYVAARISGVAWVPAAIVLGMLLLLTGIFVQMKLWHLIPLWYHVTFLALLIPMTFLGARLRQPRAGIA